MSYAHEIFGVKETRYDIWKQDLMIAGTASAVFNSERMRELAASAFVKEDGFVGYYMLLWCKYNNVPLNELMRVGQKVAIQNSDYGTVDMYVLNSMSATAAYFASTHYIAYMPILAPTATYYDGNFYNTIIGSWLKAETPNWYSGITSGSKGMSALVAEYGYSHGLPEEFKDVLKRNVNERQFVNPFVVDDPSYLYRDGWSIGIRNEFGPTAIHTAKIVLDDVLPEKVRMGASFWTAFIPQASTQNNAYPLIGATWSEKPHVMATLDNANNLKFKNLDTNTFVDGTVGSYPNLATSNVGHLARFSVDI